MLYVYTGTDTHKTRERVHELRQVLSKKRPDAEHFTLTADTFSAGALDALLYGQGLFEVKYVVTLDGVLDASDAERSMHERAKAMGEAPHVFICIEQSIPAALARALKKYAQTFEKADTVKEKADLSERFALPDALGRRDRKGLWVAYHRARIGGAEPEALHGLLFWQVKSMLLAHQTQTAEAADMKAFPYKKAKQFASNYSETEMHALARDLLAIYHDAHRGKHTLDTALERFTLSL